jgi:alpha-tubulin suppressor-like RCC1 family protein
MRSQVREGLSIAVVVSLCTAACSIGCGRIGFERVDAGVAQDAGGRSDAGTDASSPRDAGTDASSSPDAGPINVLATAIAAGTPQTCAVSSDGALWAWGDGALGALGPIGAGPQLTPARIDTMSWSAVSCGESDFGCGVRGSELRCWGANDAGQLGQGDLMPEVVPVAVPLANALVQFEARFAHVCGVDGSGSLFCWGKNDEGELGLDDAFTAPDNPTPQRVEIVRVRHVTTGQGHSCAVGNDGSLWCWGRNSSSNLGLGPAAAIQIRSPQRVGTGTDWTVVTAGQDQTCGLRGAGELWCWGRNSSGQLGTSDLSVFTEPRRIGTSSDWIAISLHTFHACGIRADRSLWCWGRNDEGQLGVGMLGGGNRTMPTPVDVAGPWSAISVGRFHTCAIRMDGTLWCTGANESGMLGTNDTARRGSLTPIALGP